MPMAPWKRAKKIALLKLEFWRMDDNRRAGDMYRWEGGQLQRPLGEPYAMHSICRGVWMSLAFGPIVT